MKILIAPDSFKESLSANEVCKAIEKGILEANSTAKITTIPMADGGEGSIDAIISGGNGKLINTKTHGPLLRSINSSFGMVGKTAIIEMAKSSGLELLTPEERNPLITSTFGTGELIKTALEIGCNEMIICIGGSATNDGGMGALRALGVRFLDEHRKQIDPGGGSLENLKAIDFSKMDPRVRKCKFKVACDVTNPLLGENGASKTFAPQKGADSVQIEILEKSMSHFAEITRFVVSHDVSNKPGAGAAGGLGFGLMAYLNAKLESGFDIISKLVELEKHIKKADVIITGEGKIDFQTQHGKVPWGVLQLAKKHKKRVIAVCGIKGEGADQLEGFEKIYSLVNENVNTTEAMKKGRELLIKLGSQIIE
ncbi:MAG: glycerate kinase [Reichenbachiella sp.]